MRYAGRTDGCVARPVVTSLRNEHDPRNARLRDEGLDPDDLRELREHARRLEAMGFQTFNDDHFAACNISN